MSILIPADPRRLGTVLGVWAHPDDEVFLSGGLMAAAVDAGSHVACVTATRGEHGTIDPASWPAHRLARTRTLELRASLAVLGVTEHHHLDLEDGHCADAPDAAVVSRLGSIMAAVRPDTIVTFGPDGFTGHEDHQVVSRWATAARATAAPAARLLHVTGTEEFARRWRHLHDRHHVFLVADLPTRTSSSDLGLQLRLDDGLADRKLAALRAQATQTTALVESVGEAAFRDWWSVESFVDADRRAVERTWDAWRPAA